MALARNSPMDKFIQQIAKEAGNATMKLFGKEGVQYMKSDNAWDCVTRADILSVKIITTAIRKKYPEHGIISEESGGINEGSDYVWIIDPVDGTLNFSRGVPLFSTMIALAHKNRVILSAIYFPATKEMYFAKDGKGARLNGKKIHCSRKKELRSSVGSGFSSLRKDAVQFIQNTLLTKDAEYMIFNTFGAISVNACYVASGRRDWVVPLHGALHDFAPVSLMLKEAGCKVTDIKGKPWKLGIRGLVAANPVLHRQLLKLTRNI